MLSFKREGYHRTDFNLRDAAENYPAWLEAIRGARDRIHLEVYILADRLRRKTIAGRRV